MRLIVLLARQKGFLGVYHRNNVRYTYTDPLLWTRPKLLIPACLRRANCFVLNLNYTRPTSATASTVYPYDWWRNQIEFTFYHSTMGLFERTRCTKTNGKDRLEQNSLSEKSSDGSNPFQARKITKFVVSLSFSKFFLWFQSV